MWEDIFPKLLGPKDEHINTGNILQVSLFKLHRAWYSIYMDRFKLECSRDKIFFHNDQNTNLLI